MKVYLVKEILNDKKSDGMLEGILNDMQVKGYVLEHILTNTNNTKLIFKSMEAK